MLKSFTTSPYYHNPLQYPNIIINLYNMKSCAIRTFTSDYNNKLRNTRWVRFVTRVTIRYTYTLVYRKCEWQRKRGRPWCGQPNFELDFKGTESRVSTAFTELTTRSITISFLKNQTAVSLFYIYFSVHRNILWNNQQMRQCAVKFISLQVHSKCFGRHTRPSSGVQF